MEGGGFGATREGAQALNLTLGQGRGQLDTWRGLTLWPHFRAAAVKEPSLHPPLCQALKLPRPRPTVPALR